MGPGQRKQVTIMYVLSQTEKYRSWDFLRACAGLAVAHVTHMTAWDGELSVSLAAGEQAGNGESRV